jgi:hypothetical protein
MPFLTHAVGQPMVLIEADTGGEWKVRADAHEHPPPVPVIDVEVVLNHPALGHLKMPSVRGLIADGNHNARGLTSLEDDRHGAGGSSCEVRIDEFVAMLTGQAWVCLRGRLASLGSSEFSYRGRTGVCSVAGPADPQARWPALVLSSGRGQQETLL